MRAHPAGPLHGGLQIPDGIGPQPDDVNIVDARVWPHGAARDDDGVLSIAGATVTDLVAEHGTPAFFLDENDFRARVRDFQASFDGMDVYYAGKAFLCSTVVRWLDEDGLGLDVASGGELELALRSGFPAERIAFHGNNKSSAEIERAVAAGVGRIVVDSFDEIERVAAIATHHGVRQRVLVRITVGVEAHTHEFIATAHEDQKFGFSVTAGDAAAAVRRILEHSASLQLIGLHSHIGSQIFDMSGFEVAAHRVVELLAQIRAEHDLELPEIDLGGGLGIAYLAEDDPLVPKSVADALRAIVERECRGAGLRTPRISVEPGRAIAGPPTITVYEVGTVKPVQLERGASRLYVSVDGGMSDNIRTALYDAEYTCVIANRASDAPPVAARVVGKHCESGDIVVKDLWLPGDIQPGDLLAVAATGAYCRAMASNYNLLVKPPVVAVKDGHARVIVRRETIDDMFALDAGLSATGTDTREQSQ